MFGSRPKSHLAAPFAEASNLPSFFRFGSLSPTKSTNSISTASQPVKALASASPSKLSGATDGLKNSPSKVSPKKVKLFKENSPAKGTKSPLKAYDTPALLQPFLPDRQSPTKSSMLLCQPVAPSLENRPSLFESRDASQAVADLLSLDCPIVSFGTFHNPREMLGQQLVISNKSKQVIRFSVSIDTKSFKTASAETFANFYPEDLPIKLSQKVPANAHECFSLEDPRAPHKLTKQIRLTLNPGSDCTVMVLCKPPAQNRADLVSSLKISTGSYTQKCLQKQQKRTLENAMQVPILGRLDNPVVRCLKSVLDEQTQTQLIPLALNTKSAVQKFKLPFTCSATTETAFEFMFIKSVRTDDTVEMCSVFETMVFFCQPSVLHLTTETGVLNVQIKIDLEKLNALPARTRKVPLSKLLIARLKDTNQLQSFYVTLDLLDCQLE